MKQFFSKLAEELKNNKVTTSLVTLETLLGGGGAYGLIELFLEKNIFAKPLYNYLVCVAIVLVIYVLVVVATVYIGRDNKNFAYIRQAVKFLGGDEAVKVLESATENKQVVIEEQAKAEAAKAEQQAKDDEIYALIVKEKEERARIEREREIAAYKLAHPEILEKPVAEQEIAEGVIIK